MPKKSENNKLEQIGLVTPPRPIIQTGRRDIEKHRVPIQMDLSRQKPWIDS